MKIDPYLHAALLLKGGEKEINKENLSAVLKAAGVSVNEAKVQVLADAIKDVNFEDLLKSATVLAPAASSAQQPSQPQEVAKKEEKKEDTAKSEAAAAEGLASLFG
jgi:large subunit ribosomal protein L12